MVEVHHFRVWNITKGDWEIPPSKRTANNVADLKGQIIPNTSEEIYFQKLDTHGRFFPPGPILRTPVEKTRQKYPPHRINEKLDEALEQTFPASDPVAVGQCSHMGKPKKSSG